MQKKLKKTKLEKLSLIKKSLSFIFILCTGLLYSQNNNISTKITSWTSTLKTSLNGAVTAFAIVGAFLIFIQYMQGNEQAQKNFVRFVIGLAVFGLVDVIANVFI